MSTATVRFYSDALNQSVAYNIILPDRGEGPFPVLMQLHGLTADHDTLLYESRLLEQVYHLPLVVVLPSGGTSGYLNWRSGNHIVYRNHYEDLIARDIPIHVQRHLNVRKGRWAIGGTSMGGYGSMRLGLKYPDLFSSIWAHSSAFGIYDDVAADLLIDVQDGNVAYHATNLVNASVKPVISFDCGTEDFLIESNRGLHAHMMDIGLDHHYAEHPGGHDWHYWDEHFVEALEQHCRVLGIEEVLDPPPTLP